MLNVLTGGAYKPSRRETAGILKGEYGHRGASECGGITGAACSTGQKPSPAARRIYSNLSWRELEADVKRQAQEKGIVLAENAIDDVLTVALFPRRPEVHGESPQPRRRSGGCLEAEEVKPAAKADKTGQRPASANVEVEGKAFVVKVSGRRRYPAS